MLRGRRGRGVSCQRARRNTRNTGSTDRMIRHVLWRERTPRQAPKRTPRARVFVSIAASRALSTIGRESFVVAVAGARRGACGGQASRPIFFEVIWRVVRHRSRKVVSRLARVAGGGKRTCKPRRCASSVRERRSTIPVSVHARFRACAARVELLHGRVTRLFFSPEAVFAASVTTDCRIWAETLQSQPGKSPREESVLAPV